MGVWCRREALGLLHVAGVRTASCLLKHEDLPVPRGEIRLGLGLLCGYVLVTFPEPLPSFFFLCQHGQEDFLFPPAGSVGKHLGLLEGFSDCDITPPIPLARTGHSSEQVTVSL